jgi:galactokinase
VFGGVVARSQAGAERLLRNQIPETIGLVASARSLGAIAASAFGAGFGGSVWALVPAGEADRFRASWEGDYRRRFPDAAASSELFVTRPGPGLVQLEAG